MLYSTQSTPYHRAPYCIDILDTIAQGTVLQTIVQRHDNVCSAVQCSAGRTSCFALCSRRDPCRAGTRTRSPARTWPRTRAMMARGHDGMVTMALHVIIKINTIQKICVCERVTHLVSNSNRGTSHRISLEIRKRVQASCLMLT